MRDVVKSVNRVTIAFALALCLGTLSCSSKRSVPTTAGLNLSVNIQLLEYVHLTLGKNGLKEARFSFPLLQVYDETGRLIFVSHDARANSDALKNFDHFVIGLHPIVESSPLAEVAKQLPDLRSKETSLLSTKHMTVLTVFLESCHACSVQEEEVDKTRGSLIAKGVNLVVIHVAKPDSPRL